MFEQTFKNIDDILHKDAGCGSELDYVEQTSWVLFLKYLEDFERDKQTATELWGKTYQPIIEEQYKWHVWAVPKTPEGKIDHHQALNGDDLKDSRVTRASLVYMQSPLPLLSDLSAPLFFAKAKMESIRF